MRRRRVVRILITTVYVVSVHAYYYTRFICFPTITYIIIINITCAQAHRVINDPFKWVLHSSSRKILTFCQIFNFFTIQEIGSSKTALGRYYCHTYFWKWNNCLLLILKWKPLLQILKTGYVLVLILISANPLTRYFTLKFGCWERTGT